MRTTVTLDDDVAALIETERVRTGETFKEAINRLLRRAARQAPPAERPELPVLPGRPLLDVSDVSAVLAALEDEHLAEHGLP